MSLGTLRVGILADGPLALHHLQSVISGAGYHVVSSVAVNRLSAEALVNEQVDVWVVELAGDDDSDCVDMLYSASRVPVLLGDGIPDQGDVEAFPRWQKRVRAKLLEMLRAGDVQTGLCEPNPIIAQAQKVTPQRLETVWVLAASLGGPDSVKAFLDALPDNLPVAFVYAQHTNDAQGELLAQVLGRHNRLRFELAHHVTALRHGQVLIVPTEHRLRFLPMGRVEPMTEPWPRPFAPNLSWVIEDVARVYRNRCGVIIFSGMSDDGAAGAGALKERGGEVWVQSPASCACSSMPEAALSRVCPVVKGTPVELARMLAEKFAGESRFVENEKRTS